MENRNAVRRQVYNNDEIFVQSYQRIYQWGMQITRQDRELTEDLVHELYVHFMEVNTRAADVICFENYLYVALRNSYFSHLRRIARQRKHFTDVELESVEEIDSTDPLQRLQVSESLYSICQYACLRKKTSISACILLLRFFYGYFPSEIALILNGSRNLVEVALLTARREIASCLEEQNSAFDPEIKKSAARFVTNDAGSSSDIAAGFRRLISAAREGDCLEPEMLADHYQSRTNIIARDVLSHLVSCPACLNIANRLRNLPPLSERHPFDTIGREAIVRKRRVNKNSVNE